MFNMALSEADKVETKGTLELMTESTKGVRKTLKLIDKEDPEYGNKMLVKMVKSNDAYARELVDMHIAALEVGKPLMPGSLLVAISGVIQIRGVYIERTKDTGHYGARQSNQTRWQVALELLNTNISDEDRLARLKVVREMVAKEKMSNKWIGWVK